MYCVLQIFISVNKFHFHEKAVSLSQTNKVGYTRISILFAFAMQICTKLQNLYFYQLKLTYC